MLSYPTHREPTYKRITIKNEILCKSLSANFASSIRNQDQDHHLYFIWKSEYRSNLGPFLMPFPMARRSAKNSKNSPLKMKDFLARVKLYKANDILAFVYQGQLMNPEMTEQKLKHNRSLRRLPLYDV